MYMEDVEQRALSPNPGGDTYTEKAVIKAFNKKYVRTYADIAWLHWYGAHTSISRLVIPKTQSILYKLSGKL